jgi:hypothetical protein
MGCCLIAMAVGVVLPVTVSHIHRKFLHSFFCDLSDPHSLSLTYIGHRHLLAFSPQFPLPFDPFFLTAKTRLKLFPEHHLTRIIPTLFLLSDCGTNIRPPCHLSCATPFRCAREAFILTPSSRLALPVSRPMLDIRCLMARGSFRRVPFVSVSNTFFSQRSSALPSSPVS